MQEGHEFCCLAGVGDEQNGIVLLPLAADSGAGLGKRRAMYLSDVAEVSMQGFGSVQERSGNAQTLHGGHCLPAHQAALAHSTDDELAAGLIDARQDLDGLQQPVSGDMVGLVQQRDLGQRRGGCGEDIDSAREKASPLGIARGEGRGEREGFRAGTLSRVERRRRWCKGRGSSELRGHVVGSWCQ